MARMQAMRLTIYEHSVHWVHWASSCERARTDNSRRADTSHPTEPRMRGVMAHMIPAVFSPFRYRLISSVDFSLIIFSPRL
jgi:hypothetical protein